MAVEASVATFGGVLLCTGPNATGVCIHSVYPMMSCVDLEPPLRHNTATFAPDGEAFVCYPYSAGCDGICTSPEGCTKGPISFYSPDKFDLSISGWNSFIESFECRSNESSLPRVS
ncbi:hypothetical protein B0T16DRAFT_330365 [Cercophora newfieldiana]|uniref:Uncharacterized protein n=1 Tax=Cercophora newfieldiana TaxID=92897 RepID=A0AA40CPM6_9PEZI|nr:hypothetical protein B0T16DRAFT_330365 [Cercophora newfieldiana]